MQSRLLIIVLLLLSAFVTVSHADINRETRRAQKLLTAGDYAKSFNEYLRLANEKDNPLAKLTIAMFYDNGWGRQVDPVKACEWYEKAAQHALPLAADQFARCLRQGIHRDADYVQAVSWYQKAADMGHHYSLCHLGELYLSGQGVEKDADRALELCKQSAEQASVPAMLWLGRVYTESSEVRDLKAALHWISTAASYHSVEAQYRLGTMLRDGKGIDKDPLVARFWFEKSASNGYVPAYIETAKLYFDAPVNPETGLWYENDLAKAYLWLSATLQRTKSPEQRASTLQMLEKVLEVMPDTWVGDLDTKVAAHLKEYASGDGGR